MDRNARSFALAFAAAAVLGFAASSRAEPPAVVVSIKPLHSLVAAVMDGIGRPALLVRAGADPHTYSMKPSEAEALAKARLAIWAGPGVEGFLEKPLRALAGKARILQLDREKSLKLLKAREGGAWEAHEVAAAGAKTGHAHGHRHAAIDGHLWLDPDNAAAIVRLAARELGTLDAANAAKYAANSEAMQATLKALDGELRAALAPIEAKRFIVSHDSIQYFEKRYGLAAAGSISISPERAPSAKRLADLRKRIEVERIVCVFGEPQMPDSLVKTVVGGTRARAATLDTDGGVAVAEGKDAYPAIMRNIAHALVDCLAKD
jgi:zinc transport system substrate-binding protein